MSKKKSPQKKEMQRVYKDSREFDHDLYKLENDIINLNASPFDEEGDWVDDRREHKHFYHTHDSDGKKHTHCAMSVGHSHEILWEEVNGEMVPKCGPAVTQKRIKKGRNVVKEWRPIRERSQHTHDVAYMFSEKIKPRKMNQEAAMAMNAKIQEEANLKANPCL